MLFPLKKTQPSNFYQKGCLPAMVQLAKVSLGHQMLSCHFYSPLPPLTHCQSSSAGKGNIKAVLTSY